MTETTIHTFKNFFGSSLDERRNYFVEEDPKYLELEAKLFSKFPSLKNQRLIYMPEMLNASFYLNGSNFYTLETVKELDYKGQCHLISYELFKAADPEDKATLYHGFYLIDNLWRLHSWICLKSVHIDGTGNKSKAAFGRPVDPVTFEGKIL